MANEFVARKGLIVPSGSNIWVVSGSVTASRFIGTASNAVSSSFVTTASYAYNGFPYNGNAVITGSLNVTQAVTASYFSGDGRNLTNIKTSLAFDNYQIEGDGVTSQYILSKSYYDADSMLVTVGGVTYIPTTDYTFNTLTKEFTFTEAPPSQSNILIRIPLSTGDGIGTFSGSFIGNGGGLTNLQSNLAIDNHTFIGDGVTQNYILSSSYSPISLLVTVGGLRYINDNDYTLSSNTIQFTDAPASESIIYVQALISVSSGSVGTFSGSFLGTASYAQNVPKIKAGSVTNTQFGGTPLTASVTFTTAYPTVNYAIAVTGEDSRAWMIQSKTTNGFVINSVSNTALTGTTYWTCTPYGES